MAFEFATSSQWRSILFLTLTCLVLFLPGFFTIPPIDRDEVRFTRRDSREATRLGHTQLRVHLGRLEELEYLLVHVGGGKRRVLYSLAYDPNLAGVEADLAGAWRPFGGEGDRQDSSRKPLESAPHGGPPKKSLKAIQANGRSYRTQPEAR